MKKETIMRIRGLPAMYVDQEMNVVESREEKIFGMVQSIPDDRGVKLFMYGAIGGVINLFDNRYGIEGVAGIDYKEYFASCFGDNGTRNIPRAKVVVIYNIGMEKALNLEFSSRILLGIIKQLNNNKQHVIIHSEIPNSVFKQKYNIVINNVLNMPVIPDVKLDI